MFKKKPRCFVCRRKLLEEEYEIQIKAKDGCSINLLCADCARLLNTICDKIDEKNDSDESV